MIVYVRPSVPLLPGASPICAELPIPNLMTPIVGASRRREAATPARPVRPETNEGQDMLTNEAGMCLGMSGFSGNFVSQPVESRRRAVRTGSMGGNTRKKHPHPQSWNVPLNQKDKPKTEARPKAGMSFRISKTGATSKAPKRSFLGGEHALIMNKVESRQLIVPAHGPVRRC